MRNRHVFLLFAVLFGALGCGGDDAGGGLEEKSSALCSRICAGSAKANCAADPDPRDCVDTCEGYLDETPRQCEAKLEAFTRCASKATFTCGADDESTPKGCERQLEAWARCVNLDSDGQAGDRDGETTGSRDGGVTVPTTPSIPSPPGMPTSGGDAGTGTALMCAAKSGDDACTSCTKSRCCDAIAACGADCQRVFQCVSACTTDACITSCAQAAPVGAQQFLALGECQESACSSVCAGDSDGDTTGNVGDDSSDPFASGDCLPRGSVPAGYCNVAGKPNAYECVKPPFPGCVASPTGAEDVYCCSQ